MKRWLIKARQWVMARAPWCECGTCNVMNDRAKFTAENEPRTIMCLMYILNWCKWPWWTTTKTICRWSRPSWGASRSRTQQPDIFSFDLQTWWLNCLYKRCWKPLTIVVKKCACPSFSGLHSKTPSQCTWSTLSGQVFVYNPMQMNKHLAFNYICMEDTAKT